MSQIMEKTFAALPNLLTGGAGSANKDGTSGFQQFVKMLGNIQSSHEEKHLIQQELEHQRQKLALSSTTLSQKRESLMRLVYCHLLGYDVDFAYIHAVKLAQQGSILEKRVGYLTCSIFLHEDHELVLLLVNTIQKDLTSTNALEICFALTAASQLISAEMIPAILPAVQEKVSHSKETVRRKAVLALHSFLLKAPTMVQHLQHVFRNALCDKQPGVMWASLHIYMYLAKSDPASYQDMVPTFLNILQQILNRHLPSEYEHHNIPAPWLTVLLLKILAVLGAGQPTISAQIYPLMHEVLQRTETTHKAGLAVIYECLETIACLHPHPKLVQHAANCVTRFLTAKSINYKYLGLKALICLVKLNPEFVIEHQQLVVDCLEHEDFTIRSKTLELLFYMANPSNVQVVCNKLMDHLNSPIDKRTKSNICEKIAHLTNRFSSNGEWYIDTINRLLIQSGQFLPPRIHEDVINRLASESSEEIKLYAVKCYWSILHETGEKTPDCVLQISVWVLGEFSPLTTMPDLPQVTSALLQVYSTSSSQPVQLQVLAAFRKLILLMDGVEHVVQQLRDNTICKGGQVKQRLCEIERLGRLSSPEKEAVLAPLSYPLDLTLSFLDDYVSDDLENGGTPFFKGSHQMTKPEKDLSSLFVGLKFTEHQREASPLSVKSSVEKSASISSSASHDSFAKESLTLNTKGVKQVWGPKGRNKNVTTSRCKPELNENQKVDPVCIFSPDDERKSQLAASLFQGISASNKQQKIITTSDITNMNADVNREYDTEHPILPKSTSQPFANANTNVDTLTTKSLYSSPDFVTKDYQYSSSMYDGQVNLGKELDRRNSFEEAPPSEFHVESSPKHKTLDQEHYSRTQIHGLLSSESVSMYTDDSLHDDSLADGDKNPIHSIQNKDNPKENREEPEFFQSSPCKSVKSDISIDTDSIEDL